MHWYALSKATGTATLCAGEHDARREAKSYDRLYPRAAPHVAVRLAPVLDTASSDAVGRDVALALEWARANAGEHADTIIEALAAYDPECGGRTAQRGGGASEAADAQLADTQRAIIEAAEARGYARAKAEGEADARDVVRLAFCIELGTVPEERPDQPKERRWSLTLYPNGWQVLVVHGSTYVECIDAAIEAAKPQRAAQQRKGG